MSSSSTSTSDDKLSRMALVALVIGSMVGAGIFTLPSKLGSASSGLGVLIAWSIAGSGMLMLALVFQPDLVLGHIDVTANLIAGTGFLFAPAVVALADTCAAIGCGNNIPEGASFTTIELKSNFLSSARVGERVTCRCTPAHLGRQTHVWDAVVGNETTGKTMALFRCTQMVLLPR
jgi:uncharacterized protein (TIGR00369 family)